MRVRTAQILAATIGALIAVRPAVAAETQYSYHIEAAGHGDVGLYRFVFQSGGGTIHVTAEGHAKVTALGIPLYSRDANGEERWVRDRLQEFHGVTTINGKSRSVDGRVEGDHFVIRTEDGETSAPLDIRPISPWTTSTPGDATMFVASTGAVKQVHIDPGQDITVTIDGTDIPARSFKGATSDGEDHFQVFLDGDGTPVKFISQDAEIDATLTLMR